MRFDKIKGVVRVKRGLLLLLTIRGIKCGSENCAWKFLAKARMIETCMP